MKYTISFSQPQRHYIDIKCLVKTEQKSQMYFQLPAWRPGRYELSNFAKNIQQWAAFDENGNPLPYRKITKDRWEVDCAHAESIECRYNYFANELNAGSTFLDENQLYINPVNCLLYAEGDEGSTCEIDFQLPENYRIAGGLKKHSSQKNTFTAENFDQLVDCPMIASPSLQCRKFSISGTQFFLWVQGEFKADWELLEKDFGGFIKEHIKFFGGFPTKEYHFLFQFLTTSFYHGVEHANSTVIALGPAYAILKNEGRYEDLLGVSSHELFHTWNVKRIRPVEMWPYDFTKENYTKLGYLTEGATTWYGDIMLYRSGVFGDEAFFRTFKQLLDRHYNNPGARNLSVADSSFDTWLDGYEAGVPNRKASIYTEGALITFILDVEIRRNTENRRSFDEVMQRFYRDFYQKGKGISEIDYRTITEEVAEKDLSDIFDQFINGAEDFHDTLVSCLDYLGLEMKKEASAQFHESYLGFRLKENRVISIYPESVAEQAGLSVVDQVVYINSIEIQDNLSEWVEYFKEEEITLGLFSSGKFREIRMKSSDQFYYANYEVAKQKEMSDAQKAAYKTWMLTENTIN